jgi:aminopeptidase N
MKQKRLSFVIFLASSLILAGCGTSTDAPQTAATDTRLAATMLPTVTEATSPTSAAGWACSPPVSAAWGGAGSGDPYYPLWGNGGYDVGHYLIDLKVDMENNKVTGEATLSVTATQQLDAFNLDFIGMNISRLSVNGADAIYCRDEAGELTIIPNQPISSGEAFTISVAYKGKPAYQFASSNEPSSGWVKMGDQVFTIPDSLAFLYPSNESSTDPATFTIRLTVPAPYQAFAIGSLDQTIAVDGQVTTVWNVDTPGGWGGLLSIGQYPITKKMTGPDGLSIQLDFPGTLSESYQAEFEFVPDLLTFYNSILGRFPYDTLGINWVNNYPIQGITTTSRVFVNTDIAWIAYSLEHELSHQWLGVCIRGAQLNDMWLFEGFANYAPILWDEHQGLSANESIEKVYRDLPERTGPPGNPPLEEIFPGSVTVYDRPAVALHALRLRIGDEKFFLLLRTFIERYQFSSVTTKDFTALAEKVSGQELDDFFQAWLFEEAIPEIPELILTKKAVP